MKWLHTLTQISGRTTVQPGDDEVLIPLEWRRFCSSRKIRKRLITNFSFWFSCRTFLSSVIWYLFSSNQSVALRLAHNSYRVIDSCRCWPVFSRSLERTLKGNGPSSLWKMCSPSLEEKFPGSRHLDTFIIFAPPARCWRKAGVYREQSVVRWWP